MNKRQIKKRILQIADDANMIVEGYAFDIIAKGGSRYIRVINLNEVRDPLRVAILTLNGEVYETNMSDTDLQKSIDLYNLDKEFLQWDRVCD